MTEPLTLKPVEEEVTMYSTPPPNERHLSTDDDRGTSRGWENRHGMVCCSSSLTTFRARRPASQSTMSAFASSSPSAQNEPLFTLVSVYSLLGTVALLAVAHISGKKLLPKQTRRVDQAVFVWLVSGEGRGERV